MLQIETMGRAETFAGLERFGKEVFMKKIVSVILAGMIVLGV